LPRAPRTISGTVLGGDVPPDGGPDRLQDQLAGLRDRADHDDPARREQVADRGQVHANELGRVADHAHRARVAGGEQPHELGQRQLSVLRPERLHDRGDRRVGFQAAAFPAPAQRPALVDSDMADFPRAAAAPDERAVDEQAAPGARLRRAPGNFLSLVTTFAPEMPELSAQGPRKRLL
jgi:hypothetical protein